MRRVYTDKRFPGYEVVNYGNTRFEVRLGSKLLSAFESYEKPGGQISESFAGRIAKGLYDRNAKPVVEGHDLGLNQDTDVTDIVNAPPSAAAKSKRLDQYIAAEAACTDPELKRRLRHNILKLMREEGVEESAESIVSKLLDA